MASNPIENFKVDVSTIEYIGEDLNRPECILAEPDGSLWCADSRGGVVHIGPDGGQRFIKQSYGKIPDKYKNPKPGDVSDPLEETLPNGMAFADNGDLLIANFGTDALERMTRDGVTEFVHGSIDGLPIGKVNFVLRDSKNRLWLTISTQIKNWPEAISPNRIDGYVALADEKGIRVVADGFHFTNEVRLDANEEWLYVVETCGRHISRLRIQPDGSLTDREIYGPSDTGAFIDGIAFDAYGNLWGTHIFREQIFAITPEGDLHILFDEGDPAVFKVLLDAYERDEASVELMATCKGKIAPWITSVTFGGPDLKTVYMGCLEGRKIPYFRSPVAGQPMAHWK